VVAIFHSALAALRAVGDVEALEVRPDGIRTHEQLLVALERLRVRAARGRGKCRLSLTDVAVLSGVPRSTLAKYLSGASFVPADQFDAIVLGLGVAPVEAGRWAAAWERVAEHRMAKAGVATPEGSGGVRRTPARGAILMAIAAVALGVVAGVIVLVRWSSGRGG
jgi:hypothetical protein